ncbi:hypothetical protein [Nisaea nitritireducens]|uniref:hypothetical protein n=1 Tax=Nisaea nitritireducens TaxID=568392 RepID=UPI0018665762|nr:hypothetical protein [Nisaea nitritireducens]
MDGRPLEIKDGDWVFCEQVGAVYGRTFYPSFIDLAPNSAYMTVVDSVPVFINIVRHVRALEIIDYNNELFLQEKGNGKVSRIKYPIHGVDSDNSSAVISDKYGSSGVAIAVENKNNGKIFGNSSFTEVIIGREVKNEKEYDDLRFFSVALRKLLYTYRYLTPDLRSRIDPSNGCGGKFLMTARTLYSGTMAPTALERLSDSIPEEWSVTIVKVDDYVSGVAGHSNKFGDISDRSENVGSFLMSGFILPKSLFDLEIVMENAFHQKNMRMGVFEAMCLAELSLLDSWKHFRKFIALKKYSDDERYGWKFLSQKLLPRILSLYDGDKAEVLRRIAKSVTFRHDVVHKGYMPTGNDLDEVVSSIKMLLTITEIPNRYKAHWHLKPEYPERKLPEIYRHNK